MSNLRHTSVIAALVLGVAQASLAKAPATRGAQGAPQHGVVTAPGRIQWSQGPAALPPGAKAAVLEGDPAKPGMFTMRVKMPAGCVIAPHTHPRDERVTVISGELQLGMGADFDEKKLESLPAGGFFVMKPGMQHFARANAETELQLTGEGPWDIQYVRASDDPRLRKQAAR